MKGVTLNVLGTPTSFLRRSERRVQGWLRRFPRRGAYKIKMATFGHWKDGVMDSEYLFWDNQEFAKEIGLGK